MKNIVKSIILFTTLAFTFGCTEDGELEVIDVPFSADKVSIKVGESVNFSIGFGADASSIYTGDSRKEFAKSRIALVEMKGYSDSELKNTIFAERIPDLKDYYNYMPNNTTVPNSFNLDKGTLRLFQGNIIPYDVSNSTNSTYLQLDINSSEPHIFTIKPDNAVLPAMLNLSNANLNTLGAVNTVANNNLNLFYSFPDGHDPNATAGIPVKLGVQLVIDGTETTIAYFTNTVRELLTTTGFNLATIITAWRTANPTLDPKKGIDEIRFIINADDPAVADDDGDLLAYKGRMFVQEVAVGSIQNMIKSFDTGVSLPFVFRDKPITHSYKYGAAGTYTATLVSTFIGRKEYSGDGYRTNRADNILASEYPHERQVKEITITVNP
jgi:hypothetical protein